MKGFMPLLIIRTKHLEVRSGHFAVKIIVEQAGASFPPLQTKGDSGFLFYLYHRPEIGSRIPDFLIYDRNEQASHLPFNSHCANGFSGYAARVGKE